LIEGLNIDPEVIQALNPALGPAVWDGRKFIPRGHRLALPAGSRDWAVEVAGLPGSRLYQGQRPDLEHAVASGETLSQIAGRYEVELDTLMASNGINDPHRIRAGQRLTLPSAGAMPPAVGARHYEVRSGDTLGAIAQRHGMATGDLKALNALQNPDRLRVGQRLRIDGAPRVAVVDTGEAL
ncbi:MAG: LysM domain-containing protein, partial [Orrella sp.]